LTSGTSGSPACVEYSVLCCVEASRLQSASWQQGNKGSRGFMAYSTQHCCLYSGPGGGTLTLPRTVMLPGRCCASRMQGYEDEPPRHPHATDTERLYPTHPPTHLYFWSRTRASVPGGTSNSSGCSASSPSASRRARSSACAYQGRWAGGE
jgi:hypothetical protein